MVLGMLRSVAGWKADKYRFDVTIHNAYNVLPGTKALQVVWKRGNKHAQTKSARSQRGEAQWEEELSLACTMFVNPKSGTYEPKPALFQLRELDDDRSGSGKTYAEATVDLLEFAMKPGVSVKRTLPLTRGTSALPTHLIFTIRATPVREGVALSEVSSDVSVADLADVAEGDTNTAVGREADPSREPFRAHREAPARVADDGDDFKDSSSKIQARTMEEGMRALQTALMPPSDSETRVRDETTRSGRHRVEDVDANRFTYDMDEDRANRGEMQIARANPPAPRGNLQPQSGRFAPPVLYDDDVFQNSGYTVGLTKARDPVLDATAGRAFDGLVPGLDHLRLIVGRVCKINVRANDAFGNARSTGGDAVEGLLLGPLGEEGTVKVKDHGDGTYGLEFVCTSQGVWRLRLRFNGRHSETEHELVVSYGPLVANDLAVKPPKPPFVCGAYTDIAVEVAEPELGRVMSGGEAFSVRVISPSAMSMSVPLELEPRSTRAVATVCWPEVGAHVVSVTLDGVNLPKSPMNIDVAPEDICLAACQIQGSGTHRAIAGERASFVVEAHDARGNRLVSGEAPLSVVVRALASSDNGRTGENENPVARGQILDYGNGAYEASYVVRVAGPYEVALVLMGEELVMKGTCEPGRAVVPGCVLLGDAVLDLEVGSPGVFSVERRDAYGNATPSRQGQVKLRCVADGPGDVDVHVVDCAGGKSNVVASANVAGRYFITVTGGDDQDPIPGSPFELVAYPGAAAANASVTSVYGAQLASPDSDVLTAVAGDEVTLTVSPRDSFGNKTVFGPGSRVTVSALLDGDEALLFEDAGGPRAEATLRGALTAAGSYLLAATIGDEPLAGYPRILQIVPGATDPRRCVLFGDALAGVDCGTQSSLTMHAADRFGNLRATGGDVVDLSMLAPDGKTVVAAAVADHADGTYGASFKLDQAGAWGLQLIVNGRGGRTDVSEVIANFGPCKAQDCTFAGFGMDGLEGVTTLSSSQIRVFPTAYESANRRMSGKESLSVRVLTPSGGISAVDLKFDRGQYLGAYRWTQPGLHTVSVSLEQEAVVGSPFTVEALASLPEIRELENMSVGDINAILVKMTPDASSQALASLPPEQAAEALAGHSGAAAARMMNGMFPSATAQVLGGMPDSAAAAAVGAMSEEKTRDVLGAMAPADTANLMAAMSPEETSAKADVFASALAHMSDEDSANALKAMAAASGDSPEGVAAVMSKMPASAVANALASMSPADNVKLVGGMGANEAASAIGAMDDGRKREVLSAMGDKELLGLTDGLGAAYEDDKRLPAAERQQMREAAAERAKSLAPALAGVPPAKLADSLKNADASQVAGTLNALVHEGKAAADLLRALPKDAQKKAVGEMLGTCPEGTAGAILSDFTGEECAAIMAGASPDAHAKCLAELCKENPKAACSTLAAMNPEDASAAMSLIVDAANNGTGRVKLTDSQRTSLFKCCPSDVLRGVRPATSLGSMCASTMSASEAAAVLGALEPNAAAACLEGMSGEEVRQVLEASAGAGAGGGRDSPLVAAMVPYMASLDGAGAAAMIEALPPDMAVGVMMNTPDDRAREVLAHTKNRALKERVANRATMALEACDVDLRDDTGANAKPVAGERFTFKLISRESGGTRINHGGAHLTATIHPPGGKKRAVTQGSADQCQVLDLGNGVYEVTGVSNVSGKSSVLLQSGSQRRDVAVFVDAAEPMVAATTFDRTGLAGWRAGEPGVLKLILRDRYGNEVRAASALFTFEGRASGPGGVAVEQRANLDDGGVLFEFKSTVAGIYKIGVACVDTDEVLPGLPIDVTMLAGKISHVGCTATLQTITGAGKGPGASAAAFGVAVAMAGEEITALVDARDRFGNATTWSGESASVVAHGPANEPADRAFDVVDVRGGRAGLRGVLPRAGSYTVAVCVDDIPCACSPLVLHVYPGPCETSRAAIRGDALSGVLRGAPATVIVQTEDKFGNNCHGGGDQVDLVLQGPTGVRASAVDVVDHGDGSYGCVFVCPMAGRWIVQAVVNGRVAKESTQEIIATYGPLQANDCVLRAGPGMGERVTCGVTRDVYLQALEYDSTGRGMSGQEAVSMHLVTPSGASHTLSAGFAERGSRYRAPVRWWEIGRHEIVATINGEPVVGSPLVVEVDAQDVSLPMCRLSGAGLAGAVAGERAMILVEARDARGNRLFQGGAVIGVAVRVGGETLRGRVHDCGDGTYEASYVVEKAGPFEVSLFLGTEATTFRAVCEAGRVDYTHCRVDGALHNRWIAGKQLAMTVTRMDRFGNRVPRREGLASFAGHGTGPGKVTCEMLELGDGSCELRYAASVAGVYSLGVFVDEEPVAPVATEERSEPLLGVTGGNTGGGVRDSVEDLGASSSKKKQINGVNGPFEPLKLGGVFGKTMFPLPGGVFDLTCESGQADPTMCDVAVVGASKQGDTWVVAAGDEILVKVIARDRFGNQTHWNDGQAVGVEARGPEFIAFSVTGATGVKADYLARMVRAGTFELRVMVDSLAVCWRAVQVVAGPTFAPRCKISMEGLQNLRTGDTCRLTLKAADQYGNLRLDGDDAAQLALEGPGGASARAVNIVDHHDGTYALEFITPVAGRWNLGVRVNGKPCVEGGVSFGVAFGTLTAEEAVVTLSPTIEETEGGVYECGGVATLTIAGVDFESSGRLMTGLEAVTVRLLHPSGTQEALPVVLAKDMTRYSAPIRWLHPGDHAISVLLDGVQVKGTPLRARAEGMEVSLSSCAFIGDGHERCVAGERAVFKMEAKDYSGNRIHRGGAPLLIETRVPGEDPTQGTVTDVGDGTYELSYCVEKAGAMEVAVILAKSSPTVRALPVTCVAGPMEPAECRVDAGKLMLHWPAGEPGVCRVTRKDRFGNQTRDAGALNRLAAEVTGPGSCDCEAVELGDGTCELRLRASAAGSYDVSIIALAVPGPGGPVEVGHFQAEVTSGPTFPSACVARMALLVNDPTDPSGAGLVEESLGEPDGDITLPATVMAGDRVLVYVLPRDSSGNKTRWSGGERIAVSARGPAETTFEPLDAIGAFAATLQTSGAYSVAALVGDCSAAGWPRVLQVVAGPCDPDRCVLSGDALGSCATGVALTLQLQAADRYGNPRSMGGDMVEVFAKPREANGVTGGGRVEAVVVDNADGTYAVTVALEEAAVHDLHVNVNGLSDSRSRYFLSPTLAPLRSGDCTVRGVAGETPLLCQTTDLYVQPANPIREMSGREAVVVTVHTPSGLAFNNPVKFEKGNRRFASPVYWVEPGAHSVSVSLSGKTLPGCPFLVEVRDPHGEEMDAMGKAGTTSKSGVGSKGVGSKSGSKTGSKGGADGEGGESGDGALDADAAAAAAAAAAAGSAGDPDADKRFAFGGGGLKPSKAASERAARSLAGMSSKVAAQAIGDMRPAAAGAVMASMDVTAAAAAAEAMEPSVAAAAMCSMEVHEAIACIVEMPKESRVAILESMTPEQLGALLSAMTPEDASDVLRILGTKWSILAVDNMVPGPAAAAVQMLTEERLVEVLIGISPKKAGAPLLEALEESEPGHRLAADAMTTLTNRHADRAAAHLAAMVDVAMAGTDRGVPGSGYAVARLFGDLPLTCQGLTIIRMTAKQAAYLMSWLGPDGAATAAAAAAKAGGANGAGFCAAAAEELDAMGFAGDANDSGGSSNGSKGAKGGKGGKGGNGGNGARGAAASLLAAMAKDDPAAASSALGALDPSLAASALSQLGPQAAADLASGVADPTVGAALLERMPTEKRAAMMVRMDPAASAAAASAMHPEAAAEAMDAVQASVAAAAGDASGESSGDSSGIAKRLAAMVGQMDPFAAAQALSAMSQESAAAMAASLPPDRAGAIIASGGIPAEDAGAMLDALPLDAADKVMAALPPNVAEKAAAHVSSDEIKERAAARAVVHLPSSTLEGDGAERCVAGVEASFRLESANPGGGRIGRGGAIISCVMHLLEPVTHEDREDNDDVTDDDAANAGAETNAKTTSASRKRLSFPFPVDARCEDLGNGTYEFTYELQRAGEYQCSLQTAGHEHCVYVTCEPGALDPNSCTVEEPASLVDEPWRAGSPLEVRVNCHDTFGNPIKPPSDGERVRAPLVIVADGEGPGVVEAEVVADESNPHATWQIARFRATECGEYELRVFATETQRQWWGGMPRNNLPGAPLRLQLEPAASDPSRCRVKLSGLKERPGGMLVGMAGRDASVTVFAVDKYDNPASFGDLKLRVDAVGPADVTFRKDGSGDGTSARFFGAPERSGSYTLRVTLAGRTVSGFPRNLQVVAARTDPTRCIVRGDALEGIRVGERCKASMAAHDAFGNSCLEGGDQVMVRLLGPAGSVDADVVDYGDGSYGLSFAVPRGGVWRAHLAVNGGENPEPVAEFTASQGVLAANQTCLRLQGAHEYDGGVRPGGGSSSAPRAGSETTVYVQALDYDVSAREVSGQEPVCLRLLSPSGVSAHVPLRLAKDGARFTARVRWPEVGKHVLVASLNGDAVVGSPAQVDVVAADVHLPACKVTGVGSSKCVAGERTRFVVEARDSRGNRLLAGGASLSLQVQVPGSEPTRGSVLDQGDGTYAASYAVDKAGPYLLVLASQTSRLALEGSCSAGATDVTKCVVDAQGLAQLTAGTLGVVRVERRDRFGNAVTAGPDMLPFRVEATGVGPVSVETVEAGDGACEVRFEAKVAGRYALHVWSGYKRDAVGGSPFDVNVLPGQAASSSCVAQLEGTKLAGPGVVAAVAGEPLTVRMQARDRFGNATAWKRWQTLSVAASGPQDVVFTEKVESDNVDADVGDRSASGRGVFSAVLHRAGAYVVWCTVGGQAVVGWPRVIQVVPGTAKADASEWRAEAETMALTSEIASNGPGGHSMTKATRIGSAGDAARARAEADSLRARLAKYEEAAAVVMEAAEATGITLKQHARAAAYTKEARVQGGLDDAAQFIGGSSGVASGGGASEAYDQRATRRLGIRELTEEEENDDWTAGTPRQRGGRRSERATRPADADRL